MGFLLFLFPMLGYTIFCDKRISARHEAAGGFVFRDHVLRQAFWAPPILKFNKTAVSTEPQISHGMPSIPLAALDGGVAASLWADGAARSYCGRKMKPNLSCDSRSVSDD
jgi:hypothetical protein